MAFNSVQYLLFFTATICVYFALPQRFRLNWLLAASLFFYASADPIVLLHLIAVIIATYRLAGEIDRHAAKPVRKRWMVIAVVLLVANLFAFKYTVFVSDSLRTVCEAMGIYYPVPRFRILLPIGISFYTFSLISYVVDVYRGMPPERRFNMFALYVSFFPKIVAGPIERARTLIPQFDVPQAFDFDRVNAGLQLILWGAFKKIVVADTIAPFVSRAFDQPYFADNVIIVVATVLYAFQLYCDFSGYVDIAIGSALILGFRLTPNFNRPYIATSIQDYWKRWHMTLTSWLTEYVYTPMSRTTLVKLKWYNLMLISIFVTFVVSGLWHGAQWTFVAWGALHGSYIVFSHLSQRPRARMVKFMRMDRSPRLLRAMRIGSTFTLVCIAYILFRSNSLIEAARLFYYLPTRWGHPVESLWSLIGGDLPQFIVGVAGIVVVLLGELLQGTEKVKHALVASRWSLNYAAVLVIVVFGALYETDTQFIYFRF